MTKKDDELIQHYQYVKHQRETRENPYYKKIKAELNEAIKDTAYSPDLRFDIESTDDLQDIDQAAKRLNIDYDISMIDYYYRATFDPDHQYQAKRLSQAQHFVDPHVVKIFKDQRINMIVDGIFVVLEMLATICTSMICDSFVVPLIGGAVMVITLVILGLRFAKQYQRKIKPLIAKLPEKASELKL